VKKKQQYVQYKTVGEEYPVWFWSVHPLDTLLSHEAMGEELGIVMKWLNWCCRSHDKANMADSYHI